MTGEPSSARVGAVVVHFGDPAPTGACVAALLSDGSGCRFRLVVVDNSCNLPAQTVAPATVLSCPDNPGFGGGANRGVAALGEGPWDALVILNNDVEVAGGYLRAALSTLRRPGVGAAAGPLYLDRPDGRLWYAGGGVNRLTGTVWQARSRRAAEREREVGFIPGAALAVSEAAWQATGGFDPAYFLYNEDLDLCLRLRRLGFKLVFAPGMVAVHRLGEATGSARRSALYLEMITATRLRPFRPLAYRLYLAVLHSGYALLRAAWYATTVGAGDDRAAAAAVARGHARALATLGRAPRR